MTSGGMGTPGIKLSIVKRGVGRYRKARFEIRKGVGASLSVCGMVIRSQVGHFNTDVPLLPLLTYDGKRQGPL
jgi:hypothetical protein